MKFLDLLESLGLEQHVTQPTHIHGHTLDLIITRKRESLIRSPPRSCHYFSDHAAVHSIIRTERPVTQARRVTYRKTKAVDLHCLRQDLAVSDLCKREHGEHLTSYEDLDKLACSYNTVLSSITDSHAPLKTKAVRSRPQVPWYNQDIAKAKRKRRRAERVWRRSKSAEDLLVFKRLRNHVTYISNKARKEFYADFIQEQDGDQRKLFRATKAMLLPKSDLCFPDYHNNTALANDIGSYFHRKVATIRNELDVAHVIHDERVRVIDDPEFNSEHEKLSNFKELTQEDVHQLIRASTKKTCMLDPMPTSLLTNCLEEILPVITSMINSSLSLGYVPIEWKAALVDPRLKKSGQNASLSNLRPVSNLQFVSKLTEKVVCNQTQDHMLRSGLYQVLQSAYRTSHSTETALLKVHNDILINMNNQKVTLLVLLDLSSAFDTVDHQVLLRRLQVTFGITGNALSWFRSYLSGRSQRVVINGSHSRDFPLLHGVPQGSCLGPLLFIIYSSKLFEVIKNHLPDAHAYADDTQLYISFKPDSTACELEAVTALQNCIADIKTWMTVDKLKLNDDKTEFLIIGTRAQLEKINITELRMGQVMVSSVSNARNLGTWFDNILSMETAINKTCQSVIYHLHNIRRIKRFLCFEDRKTIVQAVVMSRIDYCNSLLFGVSSTHLMKLQRVQNAAARLVCSIPKHEHITPSLIRLHWLPVKFRVNFKIAMLTFKCINKTAPEYLSSLVTIRKTSRYNLRSNTGKLLQDNTARSKKTLGDRAFSNASATVWNSLPVLIRNQENFSIFKSLLKTHYFREAFNV